MSNAVKKNCWEVKRCGREQGGSRVHLLGVCKAASEKRLDRVHGGTNSGRACWVVAGTLCGGEIQGEFAKKYNSCKDCEFYKAVQKEESAAFELTLTLMKKLKE